MRSERLRARENVRNNAEEVRQHHPSKADSDNDDDASFDVMMEEESSEDEEDVSASLSVEVSQVSEQAFSWRLDPKMSYSDWKIEVSRPNKRKPDVYHVHKAILSLGERRSFRFAAEFQHSGSFADQGVTRLQFDDIVADEFPNLLDYMYNATHSFSSISLVPLKLLADYLDIPALRREVEANLEARIRNFEGGICSTAKQMGDDKVLEEVKRLLVSYIKAGASYPKIQDSFVADMDEDLLLEIVSSDKMLTEKAVVNEADYNVNNTEQQQGHTRRRRQLPPVELVVGDHASICLCKFLMKYLGKHPINRRTFEMVTDEKYIPKIPFGAVLYLLKAEKQFGSTQGFGTALGQRCLEALKQMCSDSLAAWYKDIDFTDIAPFLHGASKEDLVFLVEKFGQAAKRAHQRAERAERHRRYDDYDY